MCNVGPSFEGRERDSSNLEGGKGGGELEGQACASRPTTVTPAQSYQNRKKTGKDTNVNTNTDLKQKQIQIHVHAHQGPPPPHHQHNHTTTAKYLQNNTNTNTDIEVQK